MTQNQSRLISFLEDWRKRLLARRPGHVERLSEEEIGQLVTLNTVISYVKDSIDTMPASTINVTMFGRTNLDVVWTEGGKVSLEGQR